MNLKSITPLTVTEVIGHYGSEAAIWYPDGDMCAEVHGNLGTLPDPIDPLDMARLFAAAPALVAACEMGIKLLESMTPDDFSKGADRPLREAMYAAIALVEEETR